MYSFSGRRNIIEPVKFAVKLFGHLKKGRFDLIDVSTFTYFHCFTCKLVSIINRTPLVFTWQLFCGNYWYDYLGFFKGFLGKNIERMVLFLTRNHVSVSHAMKKEMVAAGVGGEDVFVSYNGVDLKEIDSVRPGDVRYDVIFVGRLVHQKNVELLVRSIGILRGEFPDIRVGIVGDGPDRDKLKKLSKDLNVEDNIVFTGFKYRREDVYRDMKSSKVFALPSVLEGFGIVVIEANACGLPAIVLDVKGNASTELISDNGLIVKNNPKDLAFAIKRLLSDDALRREMGKKARKKAERFDWEDITGELERYYEDVVARWKQD